MLHQFASFEARQTAKMAPLFTSFEYRHTQAAKLGTCFKLAVKQMVVWLRS